MTASDGGREVVFGPFSPPTLLQYCSYLSCPVYGIICVVDPCPILPLPNAHPLSFLPSGPLPSVLVPLYVSRSSFIDCEIEGVGIDVCYEWQYDDSILLGNREDSIWLTYEHKCYDTLTHIYTTCKLMCMYQHKCDKTDNSISFSGSA